MDLDRFVKAQAYDYAQALEEIRRGRKQGHWIWYIFPQIKGLGRSYNSEYYGIADADEAKAYLAHPLLGDRLREITNALLDLPEHLSASEILGGIDAMKVKSSITLFYAVSKEQLFMNVLNRFYHGSQDGHTLRMLGL